MMIKSESKPFNRFGFMKAKKLELMRRAFPVLTTDSTTPRFSKKTHPLVSWEAFAVEEGSNFGSGFCEVLVA